MRAGEEGYLTADPDKKPKAVIDTTTSDPEDTREMARLCAERGFDFMEACVSGNSENVNTGWASSSSGVRSGRTRS